MARNSLPASQEWALLDGGNESAERMAAEWIPCGSDFIKADVIRWHETAWHKLRRRRNRNVGIGERVVTAEVIEDREGWVHLLVRDCSVMSERTNRKVAPLSNDLHVRRSRRTIVKGKPERLLWSDESARALLTSRFLKPDEEPPDVPRPRRR